MNDDLTVHGDCPHFRGEVRENGTVPLRLQGCRPVNGYLVKDDPSGG